MAWKREAEAVAVSETGWTVIDNFKVNEGAAILQYSVVNSADKALDAFEIAYSAVSDVTYQVVADATSDFTTSIQWPMLGSGTDFTVLPLSTSGIFEMFVRGKGYIRVRASAAAGSDTVLTREWQVR